MTALEIFKNHKKRGLHKNPFFYFGLAAFVLLGFGFSLCNDYSPCQGLEKTVFAKTYQNGAEAPKSDNLFFSQNGKIALETPDLKIVEDNTISGISAPSVVSAKVLGDVFGETASNKKDISIYIVQPGDTVQSVAAANNISVNTLLWANEMTSSSKLKTGQELTILPTDGVLHVVKSGDTVGAIAQKYKAASDEVVTFNNLANQDDIYIGDILIVPGGTLPKKTVAIINNQMPVANNFYIFPAQGKITQGLHYLNAVDLANKCGTPIYAAAAGVVQRAFGSGAWNGGMGNYITILHSNGTVTYYGHLMSVLVKPGDKVDVGQNIALMGGQPGMAGAGNSTGCHVHFQVVGAANPLSRYVKGSNISYK